MSDETQTVITPEQRLQVFALLTAAAQFYGQCRKLERGALRVLGRDANAFLNDFLGDLLYSVDETGSLTEGDFDEALRRCGYAVAPDPLSPLLSEASAMAASLDAADEAETDPAFNDAAAVIRRLADALGAERARKTP